MTEFEEWATAVGAGIAGQLGARYVAEEISDDEATWTYGTNRATARPRGDGVHVDLTFTRGGPAWFIMDTNPTSNGAMIAGMLLA
jgi:hypothetical protein